MLSDTVDPGLYQKIQSMIEAGRNKFENAQTKILDVCGTYELMQRKLVSGLVMRIMGLPQDKERLSKMCTPIKSSHAKEAYETGVDKGLQLR